MALALTVLERPDELARAGEAWEALLARTADPQVTLSPDWLLPWWRIFGDGRELRVCLLRDRDRLVGLAPLLSRTYWYRPGIPFRRLELLGAGEDEVDEITSEYIGILAERGRERQVARALAGAIWRGRLGAWDELVCERMSGDAPAVGALAAALRERGLGVELSDAGASFYAPLPPTWDEYLEGLSASRRYRVKRALRGFGRWAGGAFQLRRAGDQVSLRRGFEILVSLHTARWQASGRSGAFASARFRRFHEEVAPVLLSRGALDLFWLEARGEPIAALYNLVWDGRVQFYQSGRLPDLPAKVKPGMVIHALAIQAAIEAGRREYDFLAGTSRYKEELGTKVRRLVSLRAIPAFSLRESARRALRRGYYRSRGVRRALGARRDVS